MHADRLHRFLLEDAGVRGELVQLQASWQAVLARHPYPPAVQRPLGEALAAVVLLAATLKFEGSLILQLQGDGPLRSIVAQATHRRTLRGLARWEGEVPAGTLTDQVGNGLLVMTIDPAQGERYQGVVPVTGTHLGAAVEGWFANSEQLPTRLWFAVAEERVTALLLQRLPGASADADGWPRASMLADTVTTEELLNLPVAELLRRLFHEEDVRLYEPEPVAFRCSCSRERIATTLRALGRDEVEAILASEETVSVTCEFCNRNYRFDAVDARELFAEAVPSSGPTTRH